MNQGSGVLFSGADIHTPNWVDSPTDTKVVPIRSSKRKTPLSEPPETGFGSSAGVTVRSVVSA